MSLILQPYQIHQLPQIHQVEVKNFPQTKWGTNGFPQIFTHKERDLMEHNGNLNNLTCNVWQMMLERFSFSVTLIRRQALARIIFLLFLPVTLPLHFFKSFNLWTKPVNVWKQGRIWEMLSHVYHDSLLHLCPWFSLVRNRGKNEYDGKFWSVLDIYPYHQQQRKLYHFFPEQHKQCAWEVLISLPVRRIKFWKRTQSLSCSKKKADPCLTITALSRILPDFM